MDYKISNVKRVYHKDIDFQKLNRNMKWRENILSDQIEIAGRLHPFGREIHQCPICHSDKISLFSMIHGYPYSECQSCFHIFLQTPINSEDISSLYSSDDPVKKSIQDKIYCDIDNYKRRIESIAIPKIDFINSYLSKKGTWLDIGCGVGEIVYAAKMRGWEACGIESDPKEVAFARQQNIPVIQAYLELGNISDYVADCDVISLLNILEHINNPVFFLSMISHSIKTDAYVIIEVPRHPSLSSFVNLVFPSLAARHIYPPDHVHIFSEISMEKMLDQCHLSAEVIWLFGQDFSDFLLCAAQNASIDNKLLYHILSKSKVIQREIDNMDLSDTMILICRKK